MKQRIILVVEDDETLRPIIAEYLRTAGYRVEEVADGAAMLAALERRHHLILLDLTLPDEDGLSLLRIVRTRAATPVVVVSGRNDEESRLAALDLGADDYLIKPFNPREMLLRIRNVLARVGDAPAAQPAHEVVRFGPWSFDCQGRILSDPAGEPVTLTGGEANLLAALLRARGRPLTRQQLLDAIARSSDSASARSVDVLIYRLRQKLELAPREPKIIVTVPGLGYRIAARIE